MSALYQMGKLKVQIDSLKAGSIVVRLKIIVEDPLFPKDLSAFEPMISSLFNSSAFLVDQNSSRVEGRLSNLMSNLHSFSVILQRKLVLGLQISQALEKLLHYFSF